MYRESVSPDDMRLASGALAAVVSKAEAAGYGGDLAGVKRLARMLDNMAGRLERQGRAHAEVAMPAAIRQGRAA